DLADALPGRRLAPQDDALLDQRHHPALPEGAHSVRSRGHLHRRAHARPRRRAGRARIRRRRHHRDGPADPARPRPPRPIPGPHPCEYCAVQTYDDRTFRTRPVDDVIADVEQLRSLGARRFLLLDDNPIARPGEAKELFRRLIPLDVQWVSQVTINVARDPELLDLVARSGARVLSIGLESLSAESLGSVAKAFSRPSRFQDASAHLRA